MNYSLTRALLLWFQDNTIEVYALIRSVDYARLVFHQIPSVWQ